MNIERVSKLIANDDNIDHLLFDPLGKTLAAGSRGGRVTLWDIVTRTALRGPITPRVGEELRQGMFHWVKPLAFNS